MCKPCDRSWELSDGSSGRRRLVVVPLSGEAVLSGWGDFAVEMGAATAALLGLLFVAVSIRVETIASSAAVALILDRRAGGQSGSAIGRLLNAINPTFVTCSLLVIAAVILILGEKDGIYLLVPALSAVLVGGVVNAWLILVKLTD